MLPENITGLVKQKCVDTGMQQGAAPSQHFF